MAMGRCSQSLRLLTIQFANLLGIYGRRALNTSWIRSNHFWGRRFRNFKNGKLRKKVKAAANYISNDQPALLNDLAVVFLFLIFLFWSPPRTSSWSIVSGASFSLLLYLFGNRSLFFDRNVQMTEVLSWACPDISLSLSPLTESRS